MTDDEQEALSCKYVMPRVMRLASGNVALFLGDRLQIFTQHEMDLLYGVLPTYDQLPEAQPRAPREAKAKLASLNLADLGL